MRGSRTAALQPEEITASPCTRTASGRRVHYPNTADPAPQALPGPSDTTGRWELMKLRALHAPGTRWTWATHLATDVKVVGGTGPARPSTSGPRICIATMKNNQTIHRSRHRAAGRPRAGPGIGRQAKHPTPAP